MLERNQKNTVILSFIAFVIIFVGAIAVLGTVATNTVDKNKQLEYQIETMQNQIDTLTTSVTSLTEKTNTFTVTYVNNGEVLKSVSVKKGENVPANQIPAVPEKVGNTGAWSNDGVNVQSNLIITPVYTAKTYNITYDLGYDTTNNVTANYVSLDGTYQFSYSDQDSKYVRTVVTIAVDVDNCTFSYQGINYYYVKIDENNANVFIVNNPVQVGSIQDGELYLPGLYISYYFHDSINAFVGASDYELFDNKYFSVDCLTFQMDKANNKFIELSSGEVVVNKVDNYVWSGFYIDPTTKIMYDEKGGNELATILNGKFTLEEIEYTIDFANLITYKISDTVSTFVNSTNPGVPFTYTYGQNLFIPKPKGIVNAANSLAGSCDPQTFFFTGEGYIDYTVIANGYIIKNPVGDIKVLTKYAPASV